MLQFLVTVSELYNKEEKTTDDIMILVRLVGKPLSLGDWHMLAKALSKHIANDHPLSAILKDVVELFYDGDVTRWRNDCIGHGALQNHTSTEFKQTMTEHIKLITEYFRNHAVSYETLTMYLNIDNTIQTLKGSVVNDWKEQAGTLYVQYNNGQSVLLNPYILYREQRIYFYDTYYSRNGKTAILDYHSAHKTKERIPEIEQLYKMVSSQLKLHQFESDLDGDTYLLSEEEELLTIRDDVLTPHYLTSKIDSLLKTHDKGIFLLQMEAAMGKTTFVKILDENIGNKYLLENCNVLTYYINDALNESSSSFISTIRFLIQQKGGINKRLPMNIQDRKDMAQMLNVFLQNYSRKSRKDKLLLIIDGIDEIRKTKGPTIFDYIPKIEDIHDNVFILLTCRNDEDIPKFIEEKLKQYTFTEKMLVNRDAKENKELLHAYIGHALSPYKQYFKPSTIKNIVAKSDSKFLYTSFIIETFKINQDILKNGNDSYILDIYLEEIKKIYGEKYFKNIVTIIAILATSFEKLTIPQLMHLSAQEGMDQSLRFLAYLNSIEKLIAIEKSSEGKRLYIKHQYLKEYIKQKYPDVIKQTVLSWVNEYKDSSFNINDERDLYTAAYLVQYVRDYVDQDVLNVLDESYIEKFYKLANSIITIFDKAHVKALTELKDNHDFDDTTTPIENDHNLDEALTATKDNQDGRLTEIIGADTDDESLNQMKSKLQTIATKLFQNVALMYESFRSLDNERYVPFVIKSYDQLENYKTVLAVCRKENITKTHPLFIFKLKAYVYIGEKLYQAKKYKRAFWYILAVFIYFKNNPPKVEQDRILFIWSSFLLGELYKKKGNYDKAIEVYTKVINNYLKHDSYLFTCEQFRLYLLRGLAYYYVKKWDEALADANTINLLLESNKIELSKENDQMVLATFYERIGRFLLKNGLHNNVAKTEGIRTDNQGRSGINIEEEYEKTLQQAQLFFQKANKLIANNQQSELTAKLKLGNGLIQGLHGNFVEALSELEQSITMEKVDDQKSLTIFLNRCFLALWLAKAANQKDVYYRIFGVLQGQLIDLKIDLVDKHKSMIKKIEMLNEK
ncbi:P-loop domain-containing protein [Calidifontibacillus oryziterrae]|uniref:tetratricopeptide repeat protein n=1 Tax=Calidifontibacillus oryziterrae TaxID=1191699 RepID=UPI0003657058|nr:tetratricopeptide repeat protein [Calidifontibacillus oryziterrae]